MAHQLEMKAIHLDEHVLEASLKQAARAPLNSPENTRIQARVQSVIRPPIDRGKGEGCLCT